MEGVDAMNQAFTLCGISLYMNMHRMLAEHLGPDPEKGSLNSENYT